jgi:HlyD family secretion protein
MSSEKAALEGLRIDRTTAPRRESQSWLVPGIILAIVVIAFAAWWFTRPGAIVVQTVVAREMSTAGSARTLLNASGYVTARRAATVSSKVTGKVTEVMVEEGMKVEADQVLAKLDASNVQASLRLAESQLERARKSMEETKPSIVYAQLELKRFTDLAATRSVSDSELRKAEAEARALDARLLRQMAEIDVAEREVAQWQQQYEDTIIRAPFGGIVISKNAQPGEMISPMSVGGFTRTGICTIVDMGSLEIEVDVNESYINRVLPGSPVEATLDAYSDWRIPAKVIAIIPTADRQKATVKVRVGFDQLDPRILPDMGVKVAFRGAEAEKGAPVRRGAIVPKAAIQQADGKDIAWVLQGSRVERRAVTVSQTVGDDSAIEAGLSAGEKVIINAPTELTDGARVSEK